MCVIDNAVEAQAVQEQTEEERWAEREAQLRAELEAEADRRVEQAYKTFQRKQQRARAADLTAEENVKRAEAEKRAAEFAVREHELNIKGCRLDLIDIIAERDLPSGFRTLIACDDLADMPDDRERYKMLWERVTDMSIEFYKLVKRAVEAERKLYMR